MITNVLPPFFMVHSVYDVDNRNLAGLSECCGESWKYQQVFAVPVDWSSCDYVYKIHVESVIFREPEAAAGRPC